MSAFTSDHDVLALSVSFTEDAVTVCLDDGRTISVPLAWYPRLLAATPEERANVGLMGDGEGLHWPDLDEDISVEGIVAGLRSAESAASLARWMSRRQDASENGGQCGADAPAGP